MYYINLLLSLFTLVILEVVLGIDNLVLLSILTQRLPASVRKRARRWGLMFAWATRLVLLASALAIVQLTQPLVVLGEISFSCRDIFLVIGGVFLIFKATQEIHREMEGALEEASTSLKPKTRFTMVVCQIALLDIIFSLDSVLTAVGLTSDFWIMACAISIAVGVMLFASEIVSLFIEQHPTIKILALSFLILVGAMLIADGFAFHIPRGYVYFAMSFSLAIEGLNGLKRKRTQRKHT
jgi:predicted tellurium resistance membrane protein TerC